MKKDIVASLAWAGGIIAVALGATLARQLGYIDGETVLRVVAMNGLMVAFYANRAPKIAPRNALAQRIARFSGWSLVLGGLVYAGFWAFAPIPLAMTIGTGALALGVILSLGYCFGLRARVRAEKYGDAA
jgi:hypothetical protein